MASPQFQIPHQEVIASPETTRAVDAIFDTPEMKEAVGEFYEIKEIETMLHALHKKATAENLPKMTLAEEVLKLVSIVKKTNALSLQDELTEAEAKISMEVLPKSPDVISQRLFMHQDAKTNRTDWFYEVFDKIGPMTAQYTFTENSAEKLVNGRPVAFAKDLSKGIDEQKNIQQIIPQLFNKIYVEMYANLPIENNSKPVHNSQRDDYDLAA